MPGSKDALLLTTSGAADLLGVHSSTVKRWSDEGALPTGKTEGGHRRIHLKDVLATAEAKGIATFLDTFHPWEANVWLAVRQVIHKGDFRRLRSLGLSWLSQGEGDLLGHLFYQVGRRPEISLTRFLDEGIRDFMVMVGEEWRGGRLGVGEEHMATQVMQEVLLRLRKGWERHPRPRGPMEDLPVAVVGAMEGDEHDVGAQVVRVLLEQEGWRVYYLGANVPVEEFASVQAAQGAELVCISFSPKNTLPDVQRAIKVLGEFYRPRLPYALAVGGTLPDVSPEDLPPGPFEDLSFSRSGRDFLTWLQNSPCSGATERGKERSEPDRPNSEPETPPEVRKNSNQEDVA
jgi:excisionase family DNA binding protein